MGRMKIEQVLLKEVPMKNAIYLYIYILNDMLITRPHTIKSPILHSDTAIHVFQAYIPRD